MSRRFAPPKPITRAYLERVALHYLERYAASTELLRRVLLRRVDRAVRAGVADREEARPIVEALLVRFTSSGLVSDSEFALAKARSFHRQGRSRSVITRALSAKGVGREEIERAVAALAETSSNPELEAALSFARRRRIGPYRPAEDRAERRARDYAAMGRAGFSSAVARRVLDAESPEAIAAELADGA